MSDPFNEMLILQRQDGAVDDLGAPSPNWSTIKKQVPCSIWPASPRVASEFARRDMLVDFQVATTDDISAKPQDRIIISGNTYVVLSYQPFEEGSGEEAVYVTNCQKRN